MYIPNSHVVQPGAKEGAAEKEAVRLLREAMLTDLRPAHDGGPSAELDQERQHARREAETLQELQDVQARLLSTGPSPAIEDKAPMSPVCKANIMAEPRLPARAVRFGVGGFAIFQPPAADDCDTLGPNHPANLEVMPNLMHQLHCEDELALGQGGF